MKKLFTTLVALMMCYNLILAQANLFEKINTNKKVSKKKLKDLKQEKQ